METRQAELWEQNQADIQQTTGPKVIVAEYDLFVASALKALLKCAGFAVTVVSSGEAVRRLVKTDDFAAILLDSELTDVNSFALCMEMVKSCPKTLVVITSAWPDLTAEAIQAGAAAFVEKPQLSSVPGLLQKLIPLV